MLAVSLAIYTLFLSFVWGFFIVAKIHAYKFMNFSTNIIPVTKVLFSLLLVLSFFGYIIIFYYGESDNVQVNIDANDYSQVYY